ncbi:Holliday junction branch migration DNA helicase RuvB [bacterium]|jgi:holliday junction DNA helicase RuvB|nr:Holliday junction branch migration DNA helicase RuvB [bacterium]
MESRIVSSESSLEDKKEKSLRPRLLENFIGQPRLKENLSVYIQAAKAREEQVEHILFYGPPGLGKTTLASVVATEMQVNFKPTSGPAIERPGDLASILTNLEKGDILFIDEIHRLNRSVEEVLYSAMEDFELDIIIGKGPSARSIRLDLQPFTLIGATTRAGLLTAPLRDRFGIIEQLEFYSVTELSDVISRASSILDTKIQEKAVHEIGLRSRGTPRIANRLLKRVRDWAQIKGTGDITNDIVSSSLTQLGIDAMGLDNADRKYLNSIIKKFRGGPVGVETIAACISEEVETVEDIYEPYMLQLGFIERTPRGRIVTMNGYKHLNIPYSELKKEDDTIERPSLF